MGSPLRILTIVQQASARPVGSELTAACGGGRETSEWQRSKKSRISVSPKIFSGTATGSRPTEAIDRAGKQFDKHLFDGGAAGAHVGAPLQCRAELQQFDKHLFDFISNPWAEPRYSLSFIRPFIVHSHCITVFEKMKYFRKILLFFVSSCYEWPGRLFYNGLIPNKKGGRL